MAFRLGLTGRLKPLRLAIVKDQPLSNQFAKPLLKEFEFILFSDKPAAIA